MVRGAGNRAMETRQYMLTADGTWTQKDSDNSGNYDKTTVLYADGSWEIKIIHAATGKILFT